MRDRGQREDQDSEVTLSPASLLGIFLGLVLVCGVFFGFGYSVGRRATGGGSVPTSADNEAEGTDALAPPVAKPSPARTSDSDGAAAIEDSASSDRSGTILETTGPAPVTVPVSDDTLDSGHSRDSEPGRRGDRSRDLEQPRGSEERSLCRARGRCQKQVKAGRKQDKPWSRWPR